MSEMVPIETAFDTLAAYIQRQGWTGFDPYDLKAHPLFARMLRSRVVKPFALSAAMIFPGRLRGLLQVQPVPHPKTMALCAKAYLTRYESTKQDLYRELASRRLQWLADNSAQGYSGCAWGLPFDYQGIQAVPSGTPTTVITSIAIDAFLEAYRLLGDTAYLEIASSACDFLTLDIPRYEPTPGRLCFSKSPGLQWYIHNSNLLTAAALVKTSAVLDRPGWKDLARQAVNYSLAEQRPDGAWTYWGPPHHMQPWIDHYHTGFVLRALDDILLATGWNDLEEPLERGYTFYTHHMFDRGAIPRFTDHNKYPVDIHGCAEAILCLGQLSSRFPSAFDFAQAVAEWTIRNMRHPEGYYYYRRYAGITIKIPYMRWGQAWMLLALAHHLQALQRYRSTKGD